MEGDEGTAVGGVLKMAAVGQEVLRWGLYLVETAAWNGYLRRWRRALEKWAEKQTGQLTAAWWHVMLEETSPSIKSHSKAWSPWIRLTDSQCCFFYRCQWVMCMGCICWPLVPKAPTMDMWASNWTDMRLKLAWSDDLCWVLHCVCERKKVDFGQYSAKKPLLWLYITPLVYTMKWNSLQQDNVTWHKAEMLLECCEEHSNEFAANVRHLNPVEHLWDALDKQGRTSQMRGLLLLTSWCQMSEPSFQGPVEFMSLGANQCIM